jgi:hypothetical protein
MIFDFLLHGLLRRAAPRNLAISPQAMTRHEAIHSAFYLIYSD